MERRHEILHHLSPLEVVAEMFFDFRAIVRSHIILKCCRKSRASATRIHSDRDWTMAHIGRGEEIAMGWIVHNIDEQAPGTRVALDSVIGDPIAGSNYSKVVTFEILGVITTIVQRDRLCLRQFLDPRINVCGGFNKNGS